MASGAASEYHSRTFLNSEKGMAALEAKTEYYHKNFCYANFSISDCNRQINLDFDFTDEKTRSQRLEKLNTLLGQLQKFKAEIFKDED